MANLSIEYSKQLYGKFQDFTNEKLQNLAMGKDSVSSFDIMDGKPFRNDKGEINQSEYVKQLLSLGAGEVLAKDSDNDNMLSWDEFLNAEMADCPEGYELTDEEQGYLKEIFDTIANSFNDDTKDTISINELAQYYLEQDEADGKLDGKLTI